MVDVVQEGEAHLPRFNKLMYEVLNGKRARTTFHPWEIELLLDIEARNLRDKVKCQTMHRYQKAVQRAMDNGLQVPFKLSEYIERHPPQVETAELLVS